MRHVLIATAAIASVAGLAFAAEPAPDRPSRAVSPPGLLEPGPLVRRAGRLGAGPRLIAGVRVGRAARVDMAGSLETGRRALAIGCLEGSRCAGSAVVTRGLYGCPPVELDLWTVPGLEGGVRADGWRALRRLVSDGRPQIAVLYSSRGPAGVRAAGGSLAPAARYAGWARLPLTGRPSAAAGWIARVLPATVVVEVALPQELGPVALERHRRALRELLGLVPMVDAGPAGA